MRSLYFALFVDCWTCFRQICVTLVGTVSDTLTGTVGRRFWKDVLSIWDWCKYFVHIDVLALSGRLNVDQMISIYLCDCLAIVFGHFVHLPFHSCVLLQVSILTFPHFLCWWRRLRSFSVACWFSEWRFRTFLNYLRHVRVSNDLSVLMWTVLVWVVCIH